MQLLINFPPIPEVVSNIVITDVITNKKQLGGQLLGT